MNTVNIFDFRDRSFDTGIPIDSVENVYCTVLTGDEILMIELVDGCIEGFDVSAFSGDYRFSDFFDFQYIVKKSELKKWNQRSSSYDFRWKDKEE